MLCEDKRSVDFEMLRSFPFFFSSKNSCKVFLLLRAGGVAVSTSREQGGVSDSVCCVVKCLSCDNAIKSGAELRCVDLCIVSVLVSLSSLACNTISEGISLT